MRSEAADGEWRRLSYAEVFSAVRRIGAALLERKLSAERPVMVLSENDLEHALLMLAGQHVGIATAHVSPVYSLVSSDFARLKHAVKSADAGDDLRIRPGPLPARDRRGGRTRDRDCRDARAMMADEMLTRFAELVETNGRRRQLMRLTSKSPRTMWRNSC